MKPVEGEKLETLDQQSKDEQDEAGEKEPEGIGGDQRDGGDGAKEPENSKNDCDPKSDDFRGGKFHNGTLLLRMKILDGFDLP